MKRIEPVSLEDALFLDGKSMSSGLPFADGTDANWRPIYSSEQAWDRTTAAKENYGKPYENSLVVSAIRWVGNAIQEAPIVVKENVEGGKGESQVVDGHPLPKLWNRPNDYYSGVTLRKALAFSWICDAQAFIIKNYDEEETEPLELWYEPHWTIRPKWKNGRGQEFISSYEVQRNGQWYEIPKNNVIHLRDGLNPKNQRIGFNGLDSIQPELFADRQAASYYAKLLGGSAVPPFLISIDKDVNMTQAEVDDFTRDIINKTSGSRKGQPIVSLGSKAYKLGYSPRELDLRDSRYMAEQRFCAVMGIPAVVLELGAGGEMSIYNNVKQATERAWDSYVSPMLLQIQSDLTLHLLGDWDNPKTSNRYCSHDKSKVQALQEDQNLKSVRVRGEWTDGLLMRSEARSQLNLGPSNDANPDSDKVFFVLPEAEMAKINAENANQAAAGTQVRTNQLMRMANRDAPASKEKLQLVKRLLFDQNNSNGPEMDLLILDRIDQALAQGL